MNSQQLDNKEKWKMFTQTASSSSKKVNAIPVDTKVHKVYQKKLSLFFILNKIFISAEFVHLAIPACVKVMKGGFFSLFSFIFFYFFFSRRV